ncbi:DUF5997 family protein [Paramicrobacterium chengjingii]|uniref:Uncharacterized protein n=1 Tax=Paramicrobacterium chengjingii TaxID=2769067 RepID=A0ABX6YJK7_9MICO|nr:DUF5997 family protein [Microbacterium chengjingii]QPZ38984.1 hypothetical protein HCR76_02470 [Microbacterium chengjingii]
MSAPTSQSMKAATAAKKLGILLSAAPPEFRDGPVTREELNELQVNPPEWLAELRRNGPHPRQEVARKLGVSTSGLARAEITEPLTTDQIKELLVAKPEWLVHERARQAKVHEENARVKAQDAAKRSASKG